DEVFITVTENASAPIVDIIQIYTDKNGNGDCDKDEDVDGDGNLDVDEDVNGNGVLDGGEDLDGDGNLDIDEDANGDGNLDTDEDRGDDGIPGTGDNNEGNGTLDAGEDLNGNGVLDTFIAADEDTNGNGNLDVGEDLDGDGDLDTNEDTNGNGNLDVGEDADGDGNLDLVDETIYTDSNSNGQFDEGEEVDDVDIGTAITLDVATDAAAGREIDCIDVDTDGDGIVDTCLEDEDLDGDGVLDTEDTNGDNILAAGEDVGLDGVASTGDEGEGDGELTSEDTDGDGNLDQMDDGNVANVTIIVDESGEVALTVTTDDTDEDLNDDGVGDNTGESVDNEDVDDDGNLDVDEDTVIVNGTLDPGEDVDGDGNLDIDEDLDSDGNLDDGTETQLESVSEEAEIDVEIADTEGGENRDVFFNQPNPKGPENNNRETYSGQVTLKMDCVPVTSSPAILVVKIRQLTIGGAWQDDTIDVLTDPIDDPPGDFNDAEWLDANAVGFFNDTDADDENDSVLPDTAYRTALDTEAISNDGALGNGWYEIVAFAFPEGTDTTIAGSYDYEAWNADEYDKRVFIKIMNDDAGTILVDESDEADVSENGNSQASEVSQGQDNKKQKGNPTIVELPLGSLSEDGLLTITISADVDNPKPEQELESGDVLSFIPGGLRDITLESVDQSHALTLDKPGKALISYPDDDDDGIVDGTDINEEDLVLYHYNATTDNWEVLPDQLLNAEENYICATTGSFSPFALAGAAALAAGGGGGGLGLGGLAAAAVLCGATGFDAVIALAIVFWMSRLLRKRKLQKLN
ncbi:hypothetical protein HY605_04295, partial [Candidatus Peregrinibacteria bacterium]|nr:hypothetical protein [Candidatus Peregrinibacteria bacterium]